MVRKIIKIILSIAILIIGGGWLLLSFLNDEYKYVRYTMCEFSDEQLKEIEGIMGVTFPDDLVLEEITTSPVFADDSKKTVLISSNYVYSDWEKLLSANQNMKENYYADDKNEHALLMIYSGKDYSLYNYVIGNGKQLKGKYIFICICKTLLPICFVILLWVLPLKRMKSKQ